MSIAEEDMVLDDQMKIWLSICGPCWHLHCNPNRRGHMILASDFAYCSLYCTVVVTKHGGICTSGRTRSELCSSGNYRTKPYFFKSNAKYIVQYWPLYRKELPAQLTSCTAGRTDPAMFSNHHCTVLYTQTVEYCMYCSTGTVIKGSLRK